jgi:hypothetical protein
MIIFNRKGAAVALAAAIVLFSCISLKLSGGLSLLLTGLAALIASSRIRSKEEGYGGMPTIFFIPTHAYAVLIVLVGIIGLWQDKSFFDKEELDPRGAMIKNDLAVVDSASISGIDSVAQHLQNYVALRMPHQLKPGEIHYRVIKNKRANKALVLVMFRMMGDLAREDRAAFAGVIERYAKQEDFFIGKSLFLAIKDKRKVLLTRTPTGLNNSFSAGKNDLLDFYESNSSK